MTREQPNYYSIIPATVRYDDNLKANEKLLYSEITALANKYGYCWAENRYFADLYGVHKITVSKWIKNLENQGYITTELEYSKGSKQVKRRYIFIKESIGIHKDNEGISEKVNTLINQNANIYKEEDLEGVSKKTNTAINQNTKEELIITRVNNTSNNTTIINNRIDDDDINKKLEKIITPKIIKKLKQAGIENISPTKLEPIARAMSKFMIHNRRSEEVEEIILLAIRTYEMRNGKSMNYLTTILQDWFDNELYTISLINEYIDTYKNNGFGVNKNDSSKTSESAPTPMINWLDPLV